MGTIDLTDHELPAVDEALALYASVGWSDYTNTPSLLQDAMARSLRVVCAREGRKLVGLARLVGDGLTIVYLQDIIVAPTHQRMGLGRAIFERAFEPYHDVLQRVLVAYDVPEQRGFYESMGMKETGDLDRTVHTFIKVD